jgi:co-chaperonin GroES (HSP10)
VKNNAKYGTIPVEDCVSEYVTDWPDWKIKAGCCLIIPDKAKTKSLGGILYPDDAKPMDNAAGRVVKIGDNRQLANGMSVEPGFEVGDRVLFKRWAGEHWLIGHEDYICLVKFDAVEAIVT